MGYVTYYQITISATSERRRAIATEIVRHAWYLNSCRQLEEGEFNDSILTFKCTQWRPFELNDLSGWWYNKYLNFGKDKGQIRGIPLLVGETIDLLGVGEDVTDVYRIVATKGSIFRQTAKVKFVNKRDVCELDEEEEGYKCSGCGCCCDVEREFFALPTV